MVARPAKPYRSANAGEMSPDIKGRIDIKQYYSAGLAFKNVEPVPQSGWRQMGGSRRIGTYPGADRPRFVDVLLDDDTAITAVVTAGLVEFFTAEAGKIGEVVVAGITSGMLRDLGFYAEARTIGIFHHNLESVRLFQTGPAPGTWTADVWPYDPPPAADLGGTYPMTDDVWEIALRWTGDMRVVVNVTIDRETTAAVEVASTGSADWDFFAEDLEDAINALPAIPSGVTVSHGGEDDDSIYLTVTFGGDASGREYQLSAIVSNTSEAAALAYHREIGKTTFPPLFSAGNGWPGTATLVQDRLTHTRIRSLSGAIAWSRTGEYFDFDVEASTDDAARLDKLRSRTSETVLAVKEATYVLVFTDRAAYFITNREIVRNQPLNFSLASEIGGQPGCEAFDLDGMVFYVTINPGGLAAAPQGGNQLISLVYNDVSTRFDPAPESLLASHLVTRIIRTARQKPEGDLDASKGWMMRTDGRLVAAQVIKNQAITGFCEWIAAAGGQVREIRIDTRNRLWMAIQRGERRTIEIYDTALFLQDVVTATADLSGDVTGLAYEDGAEVWAVAQGFVLGPFTVADGEIALGEALPGAVTVGRWRAPLFESMPEVMERYGGEVLIRPGRIHTVQINVVDTTSIAVGANGAPARDVPLARVGDPVDVPTPARTEKLEVTGLEGFVEYPTLRITQTRPGKLRVRDFTVGAKL